MVSGGAFLLTMITALLSIPGTSLHAQPIPNLAELIAAHPKQALLAHGQTMGVGEEVAFPSGNLILKGFL